MSAYDILCNYGNSFFNVLISYYNNHRDEFDDYDKNNYHDKFTQVIEDFIEEFDEIDQPKVQEKYIKVLEVYNSYYENKAFNDEIDHDVLDMLCSICVSKEIGMSFFETCIFTQSLCEYVGVNFNECMTFEFFENMHTNIDPYEIITLNPTDDGYADELAFITMKPTIDAIDDGLREMVEHAGI